MSDKLPPGINKSGGATRVHLTTSPAVTVSLFPSETTPPPRPNEVLIEVVEHSSDERRADSDCIEVHTYSVDGRQAAVVERIRVVHGPAEKGDIAGRLDVLVERQEMSEADALKRAAEAAAQLGIARIYHRRE